jgi:hypothetical protein
MNACKSRSRHRACPEPTTEGARRERWTYEQLGAEVGMSGSQAHVILECNDPCEPMIDRVPVPQRNVKDCYSGETGLRRTAAGMLEAEKQFRTWRPGWPDPSAQASMTVTPTSTRTDARRPGGAAALHRR